MSSVLPIVSVSKIVSQYSTVIVGFDGVLYDGKEINLSAIKAVSEIKKSGKTVILLSNSAKRISDILKILKNKNISPKIFSLIMTAGEIMRILFKKNSKKLFLSGKKYFRLGAPVDEQILRGQGFERVDDINQADFLFVGGVDHENEKVEHYHGILECAAALDVPLVCVGNDVAAHINGEVCDGSGLFAEQYAMMGGRIYTFGKPDMLVLKYVLEDFPTKPEELLIIGDNLQTDIKMANLYGSDSILVTKGVHRELLGEGYIPDLQKAKDLSSDYGTYPKYLMSELRW